ncbi:MAG: 50S ribosomal protein L3 [Patescibacteria group bacterium]|nr:50S ribosomal protein L3 [Patescibacteria group bacterium]
MRAILAEKKEMTHIFDEKGHYTPVTILLATPNTVTQVKSKDKDGYAAIQVGYGEKRKHKKPVAGHLSKAKASSKKLLEVALGDEQEYKLGDKISLDIFAEGETVTVQGVSKGKGFAGTIKRHNFHRGPMTHGSRNHRAPGSIGAGYPQHVMKGQKLPGRMGAEKVTVKNLKIARIIPEENLLLVKGAVPGPKKGIVLVYSKLEKKAEKEEAK